MIDLLRCQWQEETSTSVSVLRSVSMRPIAQSKYGQQAWVELMERTLLYLNSDALELSCLCLKPGGKFSLHQWVAFKRLR